jgi:hypothetical protein
MPDNKSRLQWMFKSYLDNPNGSDAVKKQLREHDPSCASLIDVWMPRRGGVSCPGDLGECSRCELTFYNEGLFGQYTDDWKLGDPVYTDEDGDELHLCECCGRHERPWITFI